MVKSLSVAVCLLLAPALCGAEIFKCPKADGKIQYQNFPCEIDSIGSEATQAPPAMPSEPVQLPRKASAGAVAMTTVAAPDGPPQPGMTMEQVRASNWGEPERILKQADSTQGAIWSYREKGAIIFNRNGLLMFFAK